MSTLFQLVITWMIMLPQPKFVTYRPNIIVFWNVLTQSALQFGPSHCPNGCSEQDLGFGGFAFAIWLPELLNTILLTIWAKLGQTCSCPNGTQMWVPS